jgi:hypothetical protein
MQDSDLNDDLLSCLVVASSTFPTQAKRALEYVISLRQALFDLCDGNDWHDIKHNTGLNDERCKEIIALTALRRGGEGK